MDTNLNSNLRIRPQNGQLFEHRSSGVLYEVVAGYGSVVVMLRVDQANADQVRVLWPTPLFEDYKPITVRVEKTQKMG